MSSKYIRDNLFNANETHMELPLRLTKFFSFRFNATLQFRRLRHLKVWCH